MPNYSNGKIYTIRFHNSNEIYIGSTTQSLAVRYGHHKRCENTIISKIINSKYNCDWSVCYYELYENYGCNSKEELNRKEGEIIRLFKSDELYNCINILISGRTDKEYYEDNADEIKKKVKQYRKDNPDKIKQLNQQYYQNNADKLIEQSKKYRDDNSDKIKEAKKIYYEKNKEKINCECGSCICRIYLTKHLKTKKHQDYLASLT